MWNRLQPVSWLVAMLLLLASSTGIAHAAPLEKATRSSSVALSSPAADFSRFAGLWVAHSAFMMIARDGNVRFDARTYNWCGPKVAQPCDSIANDQLRYGYHEHIRLTRATNTVAYGTVIASNQRPGNLKTAVTLTLRPGDTLIYSNKGIITFLCGPHAPTGTCGA